MLYRAGRPNCKPNRRTAQQVESTESDFVYNSGGSRRKDVVSALNTSFCGDNDELKDSTRHRLLFCNLPDFLGNSVGNVSAKAR